MNPKELEKVIEEVKALKKLKEEWPYKGKLKLSEIDNFRDLLEEKQDYDIRDKDRYEMVAFLQNIIDLHTYEERQADVEARLLVDRP